jgi:hypothetical protein
MLLLEEDPAAIPGDALPERISDNQDRSALVIPLQASLGQEIDALGRPGQGVADHTLLGVAARNLDQPFQMCAISPDGPQVLAALITCANRSFEHEAPTVRRPADAAHEVNEPVVRE